MADGNVNNLHESIKEMYTFKDGEYVPFLEWAKTWKPTDYSDHYKERDIEN
jgi:hypothetical protein